MSRKVIKDDVRIVIFPRREGDSGLFSISGRGTPESNARYAEQEAERIVAEINRHVDFPGQVSTAYTRVALCSHCGATDTPSTLDRWPECCYAEQVEFYREHADESDQWFVEHGMDDLDFLAKFRAVPEGVER